jgi:hypothetical protein
MWEILKDAEENGQNAMKLPVFLRVGLASFGKLSVVIEVY